MRAGDGTRRLKRYAGALFRGFAFAVVAAGLCLALIAAGTLRDPSRASSSAKDAVAQGKDQDRIALLSGSGTEKLAPGLAERTASGDVGAEARGGSEAGPSGEWRQDQFTFVRVLDGRTLNAGAVAIRLAAIDLPPPDQVCRTLDNRLENCVARAATQLELLMRSRTISCRYRMTSGTEAVGSCRVGSHDLAERLIRTGYVRRAAQGGRSVVAARDD